MPLTAVFLEVAEGSVAFVEELPGANTQGATLEADRELAERSLQGRAESREPFDLPA